MFCPTEGTIPSYKEITLPPGPDVSPDHKTLLPYKEMISPDDGGVGSDGGMIPPSEPGISPTKAGVSPVGELPGLTRPAPALAIGLLILILRISYS